MQEERFFPVREVDVGPGVVVTEEEASMVVHLAQMVLGQFLERGVHRWRTPGRPI